ncbi:MAG: hypothetical protein LBU89_14735 [Fibromonadaceae bacterium]|nr:hypothetical protein [Fibromonadaceae bacterium]
MEIDGWLGWVRDGTEAGNIGRKIEAVQMRLLH